jgi:hypothetical protein
LNRNIKQTREQSSPSFDYFSGNLKAESKYLYFSCNRTDIMLIVLVRSLAVFKEVIFRDFLYKVHLYLTLTNLLSIQSLLNKCHLLKSARLLVPPLQHKFYTNYSSRGLFLKSLYLYAKTMFFSRNCVPPGG